MNDFIFNIKYVVIEKVMNDIKGISFFMGQEQNLIYMSRIEKVMQI